MSRWASLIAIAVLSTTARADVWQNALDRSDSSRDRYEQAMHDGDELAQRANAKSTSQRAVATLVDEALRNYEIAADARPTEGEPYFRIASTLESFYTDCTAIVMQMGQRLPVTCTQGFDATRALQAVKAWDAFEKRSPLDPRVGEAMFSRAILRTKLVEKSKDPKVHLEGALTDYLNIIDHADGLTQAGMDQVWGNLAETYMMLGKLDEAIEAYKVAIEKGGDISTYYGLAVALDRDERQVEAIDLIKRQSFESFESYRRRLQLGAIFYVPRGEEYYYFALVNEAFGYNADAIAAWKSFIKSGAHPQYQARAKAHLDALAAKPITRPRPTLDPFDVYP